MRYFFISLLVLLWLATFALGLCVLLDVELGFNAESATGFLGTLSTGLTAVISWFGIQLRDTRRELEEERFSTPMALAFGYVRNFLEPAVTKLISQAEPGAGTVRIHIYIPQRLEELEPLSRQRILARIREHGFREDILQLDLDGGRARDIITLRNNDGAPPLYFDFPTTLLTLTSLVDYKIASADDPATTGDRDSLGSAYIGSFRDYLLECAAKLNLADHVELTDARLRFLTE